MSTLEATGVHANAPSLLPLHRDDVIPVYRELMDRIRPYGMKMLQQIYHPGSATRPKKAATPGLVEPDPEPDGRRHPDRDDPPMIAEMVEAFAAAARRCREGGLDGIDLHASSGYLIEQFLSPANNVRTDEYGGSLENRMRFLMEVLDGDPRRGRRRLLRRHPPAQRGVHPRRPDAARTSPRSPSSWSRTSTTSRCTWVRTGGSTSC